ncbi:hypothetical protein I3842_01G123000 [Carya illinoinensis]|uniref:Uncharacterized protein n=1 Tax=Carya illinoinensis TaxID=32201 RepID=A0A922G2V3_CARIL|nr:hypothetical protein I3842_01G123000 [Carya illinoinensis]
MLKTNTSAQTLHPFISPHFLHLPFPHISPLIFTKNPSNLTKIYLLPYSKLEWCFFLLLLFSHFANIFSFAIQNFSSLISFRKSGFSFRFLEYSLSQVWVLIWIS